MFSNPTHPGQLRKLVECQNGEVTPDEARRFLNHVYYGSYRKDDVCGFGDLPVEMRLNLYKSVASDTHPANPIYLDALNQEMSLTKRFYEVQSRKVDDFFCPAKQAELQRRWQSEGHKGSFQQAMQQACQHPETTTPERKLELLGFISSSYAAHLGRKPARFTGFSDGPGSIGGYQYKTDTLAVNVHSVSFQKDFLTMVDAVIHENQHREQHRKVDEMKAGVIGPGHPDYIAAKVFEANFANNGYLPPNNLAGHEAYERQVVEKDARFAGEKAAILAAGLYGSPKPVEPEVRPMSLPVGVSERAGILFIPTGAPLIIVVMPVQSVAQGLLPMPLPASPPIRLPRPIARQVHLA